MIKYEIIKNMTCSNSFICADNIMSKLENPSLKLHAENENDSVNGSITIHHLNNNHKITIEIYDTDELPNSQHKSTLKRPNVIPNKTTLEALL